MRSARKAGLRPFLARTGADAARYIKRAARGRSFLLVNNSGTLRGLAPLLASDGVKVIDTYEAELRSAGRVEAWRPWDGEEPEPAAVWAAFAPAPRPSAILGSPLPLPDGRWAAALGLSAASAEDAALCFVQHTHNITKLLFSADELFVVGGMERVVGTREDALFQARCAALFGLPAVVEAAEGSVGAGEGSDSREVLFLPREPGEVHVVLIDNGRSSILRSASGGVLECIGCRACGRGCAMGLGAHSTPRDALLGLLAGQRVWSDGNWAGALHRCTLCGSCQSSCPLEIPLPELCLNTRRRSAKRGDMPDIFKAQLESVLARGNPLGEAPEARSQFYPRRADGALPEGARLGKGGSVLLYLGCVASFQRQRIVESAFRVLTAAGEGFSVLGEREVCCGYPLYAAGAREFERVAKRCIDGIKASGARTVVTTCAGCSKTLSKIYPEHFDIDFETVHIVEHIEALVSRGGLSLPRPPFEGPGAGPGPSSRAVAYHDPCDLGRAMGVYEPPRALLSAMHGVRLVELRFNRQASRCCGAGGGAKGFDPAHSEELALKRMLEAADAGADVVTSACPACLANLQMVTPRVKRERGRALRFMDITEIVAKALGREGRDG